MGARWWYKHWQEQKREALQEEGRRGSLLEGMGWRGIDEGGGRGKTKRHMNGERGDEE